MAVNFKELNIKPTLPSFIGDKIRIQKVLNREIEVLGFKVESSKFDGKGDCLCLQIRLNGDHHIIFTGSRMLQDMISQVPQDKFPFITTIVTENDRFIFT